MQNPIASLNLRACFMFPRSRHRHRVSKIQEYFSRRYPSYIAHFCIYREKQDTLVLETLDVKCIVAYYAHYTYYIA